MNGIVVMGLLIMATGLLWGLQINPWLKLLPIALRIIFLAMKLSYKKKEMPASNPKTDSGPGEEKKEANSLGLLILMVSLAVCVGLFFYNPWTHRVAIIPTAKPVPKVGEALKIKVTYNHWDQSNKGAIKIADLEPGDYTICFSGILQQIADGWQYVAIGPEGRVGMVLPNQSQFLLPQEAPGARLIKVGNEPWQYAGTEAHIKVSTKSPVYVTINFRQENPANFTYNKGEDVITIKRSG